MLITLIAWQCCSLGCFKLNNSWRELISNSLPICFKERVCFCVVCGSILSLSRTGIQRRKTHVLERRFLLLWSSNSFLALEFLTVGNWKKLTYKWKWKLFSKFIWFFVFVYSKDFFAVKCDLYLMYSKSGHSNIYIVWLVFSNQITFLVLLSFCQIIQPSYS